MSYSFGAGAHHTPRVKRIPAAYQGRWFHFDSPRFAPCGASVYLSDFADFDPRFGVTVVTTDIEHETVETQRYSCPHRAYLAYVFACIRSIRSFT